MLFRLGLSGFDVLNKWPVIWRNPRERRPREPAGFTLFELMVVIAILGIMAMMVLPKISSFGAGGIKRETRHLSGVITHLTQESSFTKQIFRLHYDLEEQAYWVSVLQENREFAPSSDPLVARRVLPKGILFEDVITPRQGKVREGEAYTEFFPMGVEKTAIHLKEGENIWTLAINPLTGRVKVSDRYIEFQERKSNVEAFL